jgi:hypothetical protein
MAFEVPADLVAVLPAEERDFIMEAREWYEQFNARRVKEAEERGQLAAMAQLCGLRLGRPLTETENVALASLLDRLGKERVGQMILSSSSETLGIWLSDPNAK